MTETKVYTMEECKKHNTIDDCWLVMFDKVYNVTPFMDDHPGGSEIMLDVTGRDSTEDFEDVVHSSTARKQLEEFYIGDLHEDDKAKLKSSGGAFATASSGAAKPSGGQSPIMTMIKALLPFLIIALAFYYNKSKSA
mmetsp:Transcript_9655/g.22513  ORF Transcript_9655/g.22513 Transcript_9655/m.22513 type:complete len:137 (+) Transcript_9655:46-456(+)